MIDSMLPSVHRADFTQSYYRVVEVLGFSWSMNLAYTALLFLSTLLKPSLESSHPISFDYWFHLVNLREKFVYLEIERLFFLT